MLQSCYLPGMILRSMQRQWRKNSAHRACRWGHEGVAKLLLARDDVDVNARKGLFRLSALISACERGHEGIVRLLLAREDIDVDGKGTMERRPHTRTREKIR
jgi:hypothetical protein